MSQLAFTIVDRTTRRVTIPGVWVTHWKKGTVLLARRGPNGGFYCCCKHGILWPDQNRCEHCHAKRAKPLKGKRR